MGGEMWGGRLGTINTMAKPLQFDISHHDTTSHARVGRVTTPHGSFDTPAFMSVGTQGTIKGVLPELVERVGAQIILGNTYHLMLRPGSELVAKMGGLHQWMRWNHPILTDSGGFQVFSMADINRIDDDGVRFKSHLDGSMIDLTPARSMQVQNELGADIIMAFDDCPPPPLPPTSPTISPAGHDVSGSMPGEPAVSTAGCENQASGGNAGGAGGTGSGGSGGGYEERIRVANERTLRWLDECVKTHGRSDDQALFGIVQGGVDLDARTRCAAGVMQHDLPGYAIGGVAVGETPEDMQRIVEHTAPLLPAEKPRYLMGVGYERDILMAVRAGVDMFDCVLPTRNGRNANAFTSTGQVRMRNAPHREDPGPLDENCDCVACAGWPGSGGGFSRSYIRHLFHADEMLGPILVSLHNLRHFQRYLLDIRTAIADNDWSSLGRRWPVIADQIRAFEN